LMATVESSDMDVVVELGVPLHYLGQSLLCSLARGRLGLTEHHQVCPDPKVEAEG
jgi:hypothetical protein